MMMTRRFMVTVQEIERPLQRPSAEEMKEAFFKKLDAMTPEQTDQLMKKLRAIKPPKGSVRRRKS